MLENFFGHQCKGLVGSSPRTSFSLSLLLREAANSRAPDGGHWGSGAKNPLPGQTKARLAWHHKVVKNMRGMFSVVVEKWGEMLFTVFLFHVKSVFLFFQLLLGLKDIFLSYLGFFPVKKVKENFHCNQCFFLYSSQWGIFILQVQNWGVKGLGELFLATYLFMKESKATFLCIAAGLWPSQIVNVCNPKVFMDIPGHALLPLLTWQVDSDRILWKPNIIFYTNFRNYEVSRCEAEESKKQYVFSYCFPLATKFLHHLVVPPIHSHLLSSWSTIKQNSQQCLQSHVEMGAWGAG